MLTGDCIVQARQVTSVMDLCERRRQVAGIVPRWIKALVSIKTFNGLGTRMLAKILDIAMPRFLSQLEKDYHTWASGDDSRKPMSTGESFGLGKDKLIMDSGDKTA